MPHYQTFLDGEMLSKFWEYLKWIMFYLAPLIMISVAVDALGGFVQAIKSAFKKDKNDEEDDDYDVYRY